MIDDKCMATLEQHWRGTIAIMEKGRHTDDYNDLRELQLIYHVCMMLMPKPCELGKELSEKYFAVMEKRADTVKEND